MSTQEIIAKVLCLKDFDYSVYELGHADEMLQLKCMRYCNRVS